MIPLGLRVPICGFQYYLDANCHVFLRMVGEVEISRDWFENFVN